MYAIEVLRNQPRANRLLLMLICLVSFIHGNMFVSLISSGHPLALNFAFVMTYIVLVSYSITILCKDSLCDLCKKPVFD